MGRAVPLTGMLRGGFLPDMSFPYTPQPGGGVLSPSVASAMLVSMAERSGALVKGDLVLKGELHSLV